MKNIVKDWTHTQTRSIRSIDRCDIDLRGDWWWWWASPSSPSYRLGCDGVHNWWAAAAAMPSISNYSTIRVIWRWCRIGQVSAVISGFEKWEMNSKLMVLPSIYVYGLVWVRSTSHIPFRMRGEIQSSCWKHIYIYLFCVFFFFYNFKLKRQNNDSLNIQITMDRHWCWCCIYLLTGQYVFHIRYTSCARTPPPLDMADGL